MNEVTASQLGALPPVGAASSQGADPVRAKVAEAGRELQVRAEQNRSEALQAVAATKEDVSQAVAQMNEFVQSEQRNLQFSVHDATGTMVVRVTDRDSGELIRQIPNEAFLKLAEQASDDEPINLINAMG